MCRCEMGIGTRALLQCFSLLISFCFFCLPKQANLNSLGNSIEPEAMVILKRVSRRGYRSSSPLSLSKFLADENISCTLMFSCFWLKLEVLLYTLVLDDGGGYSFGFKGLLFNGKRDVLSSLYT